MKAIVQDRFGGPEVMELRDVDDPEPQEGEVLVAVRAAGANPLDWHYLRGEPLFMRLIAGFRTPKRRIQGADFAGVVERVGPGVVTVEPGDEVWGYAGGGAFAELVKVPAERLLPKPESMSFEEAGGVAVAAFTALQGVRDHGEVGEGTRLLVVGASGGVGTAAVQIAKALGAHVTGVCSTRNVELVRSLGADDVIDYTEEDFAEREGAFDVVLHVAGDRTVGDCFRAVREGGIVVNIGGGETTGGRLIGPLRRAVPGFLRKALRRGDFRSFTASENRQDALVLQDLMEEGRLRVVVDRTYPLVETPEAMAYLESLRARGKVVITP